MMYKCKKCGRLYNRKCDRTRHENKCGVIFLHNGYECYIDFDGKQVFIHRFIMEQKLGRKLKTGELAHHIDGDKRNNNPDNLESMTNSKHSKHHWKDIYSQRRSWIENWENIPGRKLTPLKVLEIRERVKVEKMKILAVEYGVSYDTIKDIKNKRSWKFI